MVGFMLCLLPFVVLFSIWGTTFDKTDAEMADVPRWFYLVFCLCYFAYRMLDECDGKQARRTGNSSPLGMLFDHGCDAFTVTFCILITMKLLNYGNGMSSILWFSGSISLFHFSNMEEYYIGGLILGKCNPITDLSFLMYFLMLYVTCFGDESLHKPFVSEGKLWKDSPAISAVMVIMYSTYGFMVQNIGQSLYKIFYEERFQNKGRPAKWHQVLYHFVVYWIMVAAVTSLAFVGQ